MARPARWIPAGLVLVLGFACSPAHGATFPVGLTPSDDPALPTPVDRDQPLTPDQVYEMTARAVAHIGGMASVVPDTAKLVVIKPNISIARPSGSGIVTDARVVRAVALLVHAAAPPARILIAEGAGGWISPSLADCSFVHYGRVRDPARMLEDGFEIAGHRATVAELRARGIDIDVHDLNFDEAYELEVPRGGLLWDEYELARTVIDADVWINVPVAKTHGSKITCSLKNHFGLFPGRVYGWSKSKGTPEHKGIPHWPRTMDETWIDLYQISRVDLNVIDMIQGTEGGAFAGEPKRMNLIVAGRDPIATDLVVARLMGFNPDDFEFAYLGAMRGLGPGNIDNVEVRGGDPMQLRSRFAKATMDYGGDWSEHAGYGMGPRRWTLLGPLDEDHSFTPTQRRALAPVPGRRGWSPVVWFGYDKIDLDRHFDDPVNRVVYAYTRFTMTTSDSVRFWFGSDEGMTVWLDGEEIYRFEGRRRHLLGNDKRPGFVEAGTHDLLIRAEQGRGRFDFSVNICEPIDDPLYSGNRYPGVRYFQREAGTDAEELTVRAREAWESWREGFVASTLDTDYDPVTGFPAAPDSAMLPVAAPPTNALLDAIAAQHPQVAVWAESDTITPRALSLLPFARAHMGLGKEWWAPSQGVELERLMGFSGLAHWVSAANGEAESSKALAGWVAHGRVPLTGHDDGWEQVAGYRKSGRGAEIYGVNADTSRWRPFERDYTWGRLPGRDWYEMAVLLVEPVAEPLPYAGWIDSAAAVALEMARTSLARKEESWGERRWPAGLAAWDAWVIDWERLAWTAAWAHSDSGRAVVMGLERDYYEWTADEKELVAGLFARAAEASQGTRAARLRSAAEAYERVRASLAAIVEGLPRREAGAPVEADTVKLDSVDRLAPLARQARAAEREAVGALAELLDQGPLPPMAEDPLLRRDRGHRVAAWTADLSRGVYDLTVTGEHVDRETLWGREVEGEVLETLKGLPAEPGWQLAVEVRAGEGFYRVDEQPTAANGWTAVLRVDDEWTPDDNATDLVLWAVPAQ